MVLCSPLWLISLYHSNGYDDGKHNWPKRLYGVKNKKLTCRWSQWQYCGMAGKLRVAHHEPNSCQKNSTLNHWPYCEETRKQVCAKHHLDGWHLVYCEQFWLPVGSETIKCHVSQKYYSSLKSGISRCSFPWWICYQEKQKHARRE